MTDRLTDLAKMREKLWSSIDSAAPEKRAPLFARLESVIEQIDRLTPSEKVGDPVDEIAQRRAARGAGTATSSRRTAIDQG